MNRLERVREEVDSILLRLVSDEDRRWGFTHLYGVSLTATWLAERRGLDVELAAVAGMLHDLATYASGDSTDHARRSSQLALGLLHQLGVFSHEEIEAIARAIALHSDKASIDGAMDELLKDADVAHHWLYDPSLPPQSAHAERRGKLERDDSTQQTLSHCRERSAVASQLVCDVPCCASATRDGVGSSPCSERGQGSSGGEADEDASRGNDADKL